MTTKYKIQHIIDSASFRLRERYPSASLKAWDHRNEKSIIMGDRDPLSVIPLARACQVSDILPLVFYECCELSVDQIYDGVVYGTEKVQLSPGDVRTCLVGMKQLEAKNLSCFKALIEISAGTRQVQPCKTPVLCIASVRKIMVNVTTTAGFSPLPHLHSSEVSS